MPGADPSIPGSLLRGLAPHQREACAERFFAEFPWEGRWEPAELSAEAFLNALSRPRM